MIGRLLSEQEIQRGQVSADATVELAPNAGRTVFHLPSCNVGLMRHGRHPERFVIAEMIGSKIWPCGVCLRGQPWLHIRRALLGYERA